MDPTPIFAELTAGAHDARRRGARAARDLLRAVERGDEGGDVDRVGDVPGVLTFPLPA